LARRLHGAGKTQILWDFIIRFSPGLLFIGLEQYAFAHSESSVLVNITPKSDARPPEHRERGVHGGRCLRRVPVERSRRKEMAASAEHAPIELIKRTSASGR
jgi:hypothetical protein